MMVKWWKSYGQVPAEIIYQGALPRVVRPVRLREVCQPSQVLGSGLPCSEGCTASQKFVVLA